MVEAHPILRVCLWLALISCMPRAFGDEPTAKSLKQCPNGHASLRDVPIIYGLLDWEGESGKRLKRAQDELAFIWGGCVVGQDSPTHQVVCTECAFAHSPFWKDRPDRKATWLRSSADLSTFQKPLSELAKSFPLPPEAKIKTPVEYTFCLSDQLATQSESLKFITTLPLEKLRSSFENWLSDHKIKYFSNAWLRDGTTDMVKWESLRRGVRIEVIHDRSTGESQVDVKLDADL